MKEKSIINQVKTLLGMEVNLETMTLENGTVLEAEAFEAGNEVFIVNEEDRIAVPVGEYELPEGKILVVSEEGIIAEIKDAEVAEEAPVAEEEVEVEAEAEAKVEMSADVVREIVLSILGEMGIEKQELKEEVKEEIVEEIKIEASVDEMPAAMPIKSNPEKESKKQPLRQISASRPTSTRDRVMAKIAAIKKK